MPSFISLRLTLSVLLFGFVLEAAADANAPQLAEIGQENVEELPDKSHQKDIAERVRRQGFRYRPVCNIPGYYVGCFSRRRYYGGYDDRSLIFDQIYLLLS